MKILAFGTALFAFVLLTGCADDGRDGAPGIQGVTSLVEQQTLSVGDENCVYGGIKQTAGLDRNYNNILDDSEVVDTSYLCETSQNLATNYLASQQGLYVGEITSNEIVSFKGIPYAQAPVGSLRFKAPEAPKSFAGVRTATQFGDQCLQPNGLVPALTTSSVGSEDCLTLNVFRPSKAGVYPIMVWIHGGGLTTGSSSLPFYATPHKLVDQDVVVVSINYRLGVLGLLSTVSLDDEQLGDAGNYWLKDQQAALRWIQQNAPSFGGDPSNVTIFGESAGGHGVLSHYSSPGSESLFNRGIVQSGAYGSGQSSVEESNNIGAAVVASLGCAASSEELACLRGKTSEEIFDAQRASLGLIVLPTYGTNTLPQSFSDAFFYGSFIPRDLMIGTNLDEWTLFTAIDEITGGDLPNGEDSYRNIIAAYLGTENNSALTDSVMAQYPLSNFNDDVSLAYSAFVTDSFFVCTSVDIAEKSSLLVDVYVYEFKDRNVPNLFGIPASFDYGASHAFELSYLFASSDESLRALGASEAQVALANSMIDYWTNFAKFGTPSSAGSPIYWGGYRSENEVLKFDTPLSISARDPLRTAHSCAPSARANMLYDWSP